MSAITDVRCALTQEAFDAFCNMFHIPEEVHSVLPNQFPEPFPCLVGLSHHYTLDEETYPRFVHKNEEVGAFYYICVTCLYELVVLLLVICLFCTNMDLFAFIHASDPTKVRVVERERDDDKPWLLETTVGHTVLLLPVAPDHADNKLEASVDRLFDEGGSGHQAKQGDSARGGQYVNLQPVVEAADTIADEAAPVRSRPGKSRSAVQRLLAEAALNSEVGVAVVSTLPFITSSISATPEHEGEDHTDFVTGLNLRTIGAPQRFVISSDSSHHSGTNVAEAEVDFLIKSSIPVMTTVTIVTLMVDPAVVAKEKPDEPSLFGAASSSAGAQEIQAWNRNGTNPATGSFTDLSSIDFLVGGIRTVINPDSDLQKTYFFASIREMKHDQLFTEFNVRAACQMSLSAEVRMRAEYNVRERRRRKSVVEKKDELLKARDEEIKNLKARMLLKEAKAAEAIRLHAEASNFEI
nr:hypothetical protein [Tanacetum cinerariifolium]